MLSGNNSELKQKIRDLEEEVQTRDHIIESLSQPPLLMSKVVEINKDTAVIVEGNSQYEVGVNPKVKNKIQKGIKVALNPKNYAIVDTRGFDKSGVFSSIKEIMEDGRIKIDVNGSTTVIDSYEGAKRGDGVIYDPTSRQIQENLGKQDNSFSLFEVPKVPWSSVGGIDHLVEIIQDTVETPFIYKELYQKYKQTAPKGVLLHGPPGCGKTLIAKAIAYNLAEKKKEKTGNSKSNGHFISVKGPEFLDKYVGSAEGRIRQMFSGAREKSAETGDPVVVFIDEAEAILKKRGSGISTDVYDSIVPQFLSEMDGMENNYDVIVVMATNRPDILDPAVLRPGRIDRQIEIPRPNYAGVEQIFQLYLNDLPLDKDLIKEAKKNIGGNGTAGINYLAQIGTSKIFDKNNVVSNIVLHDGNTIPVNYNHMISGAIVESSVKRAAESAIKREIQNGSRNFGINKEDLLCSIDKQFKEYNSTSNQSLTDSDIRKLTGVLYDNVREVRPLRQGG